MDYRNTPRHAGIRLLKRIAKPVLGPHALPNFFRYFNFFLDMWKYRYNSTGTSLRISTIDLYPCLEDKTANTGVDSHYFYLGVWATKKILSVSPESHVDVGSQLPFVGSLTAFTKLNFVDIRRPNVSLTGFTFTAGSILNMPFHNSSVDSISCLHVVEHIGLGRYGDPIDPVGSDKACAELRRVVATGGNLYFAVPVGRPRLCFNAHRIFAPQQVLSNFPGFTLKEFSYVDDAGAYHENVPIDGAADLAYGCGMFWLVKE